MNKLLSKGMSKLHEANLRSSGLYYGRESDQLGGILGQESKHEVGRPASLDQRKFHQGTRGPEVFGGSAYTKV